MIDICPLCETKGNFFYKESFFLCPNCQGIFKNRDALLEEAKEKERYLLHSDDGDELGYQKFVYPLLDVVLKDIPKEARGLDFGTGKSQIVAKMLQKYDYKIDLYDPFFYPNREVFDQKYHFITACEVIEHFYHPAKEFFLLKSLLHTKGRLYCMTHLYDENIDFAKWYYKNDTTHVFIYQKETIAYIKNQFLFEDFKIEGRVITFFT